ncbi:hypothetical protein D4R99_03025 [bacterium]|nr:MAG: hypothetical protein D4R99_03025 [bacterium]
MIYLCKGGVFCSSTKQILAVLIWNMRYCFPENKKKKESEGRHSNFIFGEMPIIADMFSSLEKK